jgi:hypothetical protein
VRWRLLCCLPIGFSAAATTASLSVALEGLRPWLLGLSVVLLAFGAYQVFRARGTCQTRNRTSVVLLSVSAMIVVLVNVFPQLLAGALADWLP